MKPMSVYLFLLAVCVLPAGADRARDDRASDRGREAREQAPGRQPADDVPDDRARPGRWDEYPAPDGRWPGDYTTGRAYAEAAIDHPEPNQVTGLLGVVGEPFAPLRVSFRGTTYDIVRSHGDGYGNRGNGSFRVDVTRYAQWLDGYREWYLRLDDRSRRSGYLTRFAIVTDAGTFQVRNVPAYFGFNRLIEARVTPRASQGGYYPYPGEYPGQPYPTPGETYVGNRVLRRLPDRAWPGQRLTITYRLDIVGQRPYRVELTENLPAGWRIVQASPQPRWLDPWSRSVTWDILQPWSGQVLTLTVDAPRQNGWQSFRGTVRFDGGPAAVFQGPSQLWLGDNPPTYGQRQTFDDLARELLEELLGQ